MTYPVYSCLEQSSVFVDNHSLQPERSDGGEIFGILHLILSELAHAANSAVLLHERQAANFDPQHLHLWSGLLAFVGRWRKGKVCSGPASRPMRAVRRGSVRGDFDQPDDFDNGILRML